MRIILLALFLLSSCAVNRPKPEPVEASKTPSKWEVREMERDRVAAEVKERGIRRIMDGGRSREDAEIEYQAKIYRLSQNNLAKEASRQPALSRTAYSVNFDYTRQDDGQARETNRLIREQNEILRGIQYDPVGNYNRQIQQANRDILNSYR